MKRIIFILLAAVLAACSNQPRDIAREAKLPDIYPDYIDVTIPVGIAPMNFNLDADRVDVTVSGSKGGTLHVNGSWACFDEAEWHSLVEKNKGGHLTFTVCARNGGRWVQYDDFKMHVSSYDLDAWGLTYRRIAPGYETFSHMGIYQRHLASHSEEMLIDNSEAYGQCMNCHTANRTNPSQYVFHVRGSHGATVVQQGESREWLQAVNEELGGAMVYPYWHPEGKYCAFSTNQTRQGFHVAKDERVEVFDLESDVLVYCPSTHEVLRAPLLSTTDWNENCPVFSPDGTTLYYITAQRRQFPLQFRDVKYNLCSIGFDPESGTVGERADTIFDAASMGKSVTWPRPSYDGRWLMFTLIDYGYFSIWHSEADQWMMNLSTGEARPLDELNSAEADSYHAWSADSHWVVFTSRRENGLYSQLYIASIDDDGRATKPFLLPQRNPREYYRETLYSFNTPDFTQRRVSLDGKQALKEMLTDKRTKTSVK